MLFTESEYKFMYAALQEAEIALENDEVPIGAVIVHGNKIIGRGHNQTMLLNDATAHAEILAITAASNHLNSRILDNCDLFVTVEPCMMCAGAILHSRLRNVYFASFEPKMGAVGSVYNLLEDNKYNHKVKVYSGIYADESKKIMQSFFLKKRMN